jgi:hypothetical protein
LEARGAGKNLRAFTYGRRRPSADLSRLSLGL